MSNPSHTLRWSAAAALLAALLVVVMLTMGLGFALLTALLDFTENSLKLHLVQGHLKGLGGEPSHLVMLNVVSQVKFLSVYPAVAPLALGLWEPRLLNRVMVVLSLVFPLIGVLATVNAVAAALRVLWMIPLLMCGALLLWRRAGGVTT